jgi:uncharacterized membrane protein
MNLSIPDMWRLELLHPLLVHFPIALLLLSTALEVVSLLVSAERQRFLRSATLLLFVLGTFAAWGAVWAGEEAGEIVQRTVCDPNMIELHGDWAETSAWIFTVVSVLALLRWKFIGSGVVSGAVVGLSVAGAVALGYTGHLGGSLVYQQAAAVYRPSAECREFGRVSQGADPQGASKVQ